MGVNLLEARRHLILEQPHLETASGAMVSFKRGIPADAKNCVININPVQLGSGAPSPSNVRPLTGWTGVKVNSAGKNILDLNMVEFGYINSNGQVSGARNNMVSQFIGANEGDTIICSMSFCTDNGSGPQIAFYDEQKNFISRITYSSKAYQRTFTVEAGTAYIRVWFNPGAYDDIPSTDWFIENVHCQIEIGSTATPYSPYAGQTVDVQFPSAAGTVYGGTLDVTNGTLSVKTVYREFDGSSDEAWEEAGAVGSRGQVFLLPWPDVRNAIFNGYRIICNQAVQTDTSSNPAYGFCKNDNSYYNIRVNVVDSSLLLSEFRTYLSLHPLQVICPLVTPQTYQITPVTIRTFGGVNNIWCDAGDIELSYWAH